MNKLLAFLVAAFVAASTSAAPATPEQVEELLVLTRTEGMMEQMYGGVEHMMRQALQQTVQGKPLSEEQRQLLDRVPGKFAAVIREEFTWAKMKPQYVRLYLETFDASELEGLVSFYKTRAGQALIAKMPTVMQKSMAISQAQLQTLIPRMTAAMEEAMAEAKLGK